MTDSKDLALPELCLVVLIGASGSGKSTFAAEHFLPTQVLSSDRCRALVADDEDDQSATADAFAVLQYIAGKRLAAGRLTVVDATSVQPRDRQQLVRLAREHDVLPVAIVFDLDADVLQQRTATRIDRTIPPHVVKRQHDQLRRGLKSLGREGFRKVHHLRTADDVEQAVVTYEKLLNDYRHETGPFDVIGDVHGCSAELLELLDDLDYEVQLNAEGQPIDAIPPDDRKAVFVGDLIDRGPDSPGVLRLVMGMVRAGHALCVPGNHEHKLVRALGKRHQVTISHGLGETLDQLAAEPPEFVEEVRAFCDGLVAHLMLDQGRLVVAHAGLKEAYHGRASGRVRAFALYGDTSGETDEYGLPVRYPWANDYRGRAMVLYGHTPTPDVEWVNNTLCLDTGCVFGGHLTALRYPEQQVVQVPARQVYYEPVRPMQAPERAPDVLDLTDVLGRRTVSTAHHGRVTVREENAAGALEVMSRFAQHPRDLLYLPPTMSPPETAQAEGLLEHPAEAFDYFRRNGVDRAVCEEKHMGSRAVVLVRTDGTGAVYTRTGRPFFDRELTGALLSRLAEAATEAQLFAELESDWLLLDAELLPWSAKALELLREQYAAVGAAARAGLGAATAVLEQVAGRGLDVDEDLARTRTRRGHADRFAEAYRHYCWPTEGLDGLRLAPFQLLASAGRTYQDHDHLWHLGLADRLVAAAPGLVTETRRAVVELNSPESVAAATTWWEELTAAGGEGMVVKPSANLTRGRKGLVQPGIKVRGREYLRLIYGPDYTEPEHLRRLRNRNLGHKRSLALREYALGLESLDRVVRQEPLWRIHECVFAVLALESEPVDPRL